ncbi:MAG: hypothetical protein KDE55_04000 [Novosphingobium sp.]|nr:hypothetical protein [Novosphingobium sp.]
MVPAALAALPLAGCAAAGVEVASAGAPQADAVGIAVAGFKSGDETFAQPYIDKDETRANPVPHRYVHGGFTGTDTRFSYHFPAAESYRDRFFQYITPVPDSETLSQGRTGEEDSIGMALASGSIFIETNGGGPKAAEMGVGADQTIGAYRANAAAARFARHVAQQVYGPHRTYGFAYGGSGGAYRTVGSIENTTGVWDGAVPFVMGSPMAIPNMFTVRLLAMRVLGDKLDDVVDALDAGGSGDPYATLDRQQAAVLREVTAMGFPPESWYAWRTMGPHAFALLFGGIRMVDPAYFRDYWTTPGYAGHDTPELFADDRVQLATTVSEIITVAQAEAMGLDFGRQPGQAKGTADLAWQAMGLSSAEDMPVAFRLADTPKSDALLLADLMLPDGRKLVLHDVKGNIAIAGINDPRLVVSVRVGDKVTVDNSDILAVQTYHRHQVPDNKQYPVWDQFRDKDGKPLYPQRPMILGPMFTKNAVGSIPTGKFDGKMILVENLWDREALPWQGDWYRQRVDEQAQGSLDERFRIWLTDRALHGDHAKQDDPTRVVSYIGMLHQSLRDLAAWVQDGVEPPASSNYKVVDGQIEVPASAEARKGIQPVVHLDANGAKRVEVPAGQPVAFTGKIAVPPGAGSIVAAQWDFEGTGEFVGESGLPMRLREHTVQATHSFAKPGTYFAVLKGVSQRQGDPDTPFARISDLDRVRVVVR